MHAVQKTIPPQSCTANVRAGESATRFHTAIPSWLSRNQGGVCTHAVLLVSILATCCLHLLTHLDGIFIQGLVQVIDVHIAVEGIAGCTLHQPLNLSTAEVPSDLCQALQIHIMPQEGVGAHLRLRGQHVIYRLQGQTSDRSSSCVVDTCTVEVLQETTDFASLEPYQV